MKYTEWFPGHIKPVRAGVYQNGDEHCYQYWNGRFWGLASMSPEFALKSRNSRSIHQNDDWRGLTEPHAET